MEEDKGERKRVVEKKKKKSKRKRYSGIRVQARKIRTQQIITKVSKQLRYQIFC